MGLRFRRSIKVAPGVKINLNKKSVGVTFGTRGAHYTVNSKGKKTTTVGLPGTGLSYTTSSGGGTSKKTTKNNSPDINSAGASTPSPRKKKGKGCLTVFIALIVLAGIGSAMGGDKKVEKITLSADTKTIYDINTTIPITAECEPSDAKLDNITCESSGGKFTNKNGELSFTANKEGSYKINVTCEDVKSNTLTLTIEDKEAKKQAELEEQKRAEEEARKKAEEEAAAAQAAAEAKAAEEAQAQQQPQAPQEEMVWVSNTGSKYHSKSSCSGMDNPSQVPLSQAQSMGLQPCKKCH